MLTGREYHSATLLPNGKVLFVGGQNRSGILTNAELYNPILRTWTGIEGLHSPRTSHTATALPNGEVLVAGGQDAGNNITSSCEVFNPTTGKWRVTGSM